MQTKDGKGFRFKESSPFKEVALEVPKRKFYSLAPSCFGLGIYKT